MLNTLNKIQLKLFGRAPIGYRKYPGWRAPIMFYAFKCKIHGIVEDYPHGFNNRLECPRCQRTHTNLEETTA